MKNWIVVGISGVTNGGKTSLCNKLLDHFPGSVVIGQDPFFREPDDPSHVWVEVNPGLLHQNWEIHGSVNWDLFEKKVQETLSKEPDRKPSIIFIEGHIIYNHRPFKQMFDQRYFLTLTEDQCRSRRVLRNYVPADPPNYFDKFVWPMSVRNMEDFRFFHADDEIVYIDGTDAKSKTFDRLKDDVTELIAKISA